MSGYGAHVNLAGEIYPKQIGYVWDPVGMSYVVQQQAAGGGSGGAVTVADGADVTQGAKADAAWDGVAASPTVVAILKKMATAGGGATSIADGADVTQGAKADTAWDLAVAAPTVVAILKKAATLLDSIRVSLAGTLVVTGPLTDTQLRASAIQVDVADEDARLLGRAKLLDSAGLVIDPATKGQLPAALAATGGLKVEGIVGGVAQPVSGPLTDAQLRASAVAVSAAALPLPAGASTEATLLLVAKDGTDITTPVPAMPTGGVGIRGWLSAIWTKLNATLTVSNAGTFAVQGTDNITQVGSTAVNAFPAGFARVTDEPRQVFYDPFDAALDTVNRWNAPVAVGGGVAAAVASGVMTLASGTTINGTSQLSSQPSFTPTIPAWLGDSWAVQIEAGATAGNNAVRFWGVGVVGGTSTSAAPLGATGNGYGFELDIAGVLQAVVYSNGTRTVVASLAALQPTDGNYHRYIVFYRTDRIFWYIDTLASTGLGATSNFQGPQVQTLPLLALAVAHSVAPAASRVFSCAGLAVWDTGKNATMLSDGTFQWRKATVKPASTAALATDTALVVGLHPSSPLPVGPNVIGGVTGDVDDDAVNTLKTLQVGGHASPVDVPPTAVSAVGDRRRIWVDRFGAQIVRRRKIRESYTATFRLAEAAGRLDQAFTQVANTNKQWATLYHTAAATKEVRLQYCIVWIEAWSVASQAILELRELTGATAPATGNPIITPKARRVAGTAAEAAALYLPTTQGSETSVNSPLKSIFLDEGIMGAASTVNPLPNVQGIVLYNSSQEDDEMLPPTLPVGLAGGWAVMLRTVGIPAVRLTVEMGFTEEIP